MKLSRNINFTVLVFFTLLIVNDFFPSTALAEVFSKKTILIIVIFLIILQLMITKGREGSLSLKEYLYLIMYFVGLWIVLTLLGGESQTIQSFNDPFFYILGPLFTIDLLRIYRQSKRKRAEQQ